MAIDGQFGWAGPITFGQSDIPVVVVLPNGETLPVLEFIEKYGSPTPPEIEEGDCFDEQDGQAHIGDLGQCDFDKIGGHGSLGMHSDIQTYGRE